MSFLLIFDDSIQPYESAKLFLIADECWTFFSRALLMQSRTAAQLKGLFELRTLQMWIHISFSWGLFFSFPVWKSLNSCQKYNFCYIKNKPSPDEKK